MSSQDSIVEEIREQQKKAFATMSFKEKLAYFWDYYKIHTIAAILVIAFVIAFINSYRSNKPFAFYAVLLNAASTEENHDTSVIWADEFQSYAEIDPESYQVYIDTSVSISDDGGSQYDVANRQKMAAMMQIGDIHAIVADTETFESYAALGNFYVLTDTFSEDELAPYKDFLYYTDAAAFDAETGDTLAEMEAAQAEIYEKVIDHSDPSTMEKPVAVGVRIPDSGNKIADAGYYTYLAEQNYSFQGYPSEVVIGIPLSVENPDLALQFLAYIEAEGN
ncbi:MAG: hypothetical protein K2O15_03540 [Lachnospiraceae bacterium]|nr:hypothetical protein [Lachnospiraceae bacterium]